MDREDTFTASHIRSGHYDTTVEATRTEQGRIQDVRTICCCDQDDSFVGFETVHLNQQLIQCLFAFIVTATEASTAMTPHSINLINEDDAWGIFLALFKQVA